MSQNHRFRSCRIVQRPQRGGKLGGPLKIAPATPTGALPITRPAVVSALGRRASPNPHFYAEKVESFSCLFHSCRRGATRVRGHSLPTTPRYQRLTQRAGPRSGASGCVPRAACANRCRGRMLTVARSVGRRRALALRALRAPGGGGAPTAVHRATLRGARACPPRSPVAPPGWPPLVRVGACTRPTSRARAARAAGVAGGPRGFPSSFWRPSAASPSRSTPIRR